MPGRTRRPQVGDSKLRLVSECVGTACHAGSRDCESGCGNGNVIDYAYAGEADVAEGIRPIQIGLPERARNRDAAVVRVAARRN
jgi:hypothetical protein